MEWHFIIIMYLNMFFWRFLINHSMFVIFNDTGKTAFKFGRFEYFFVFLLPVFQEISIKNQSRDTWRCCCNTVNCLYGTLSTSSVFFNIMMWYSNIVKWHSHIPAFPQLLNVVFFTQKQLLTLQIAAPHGITVSSNVATVCSPFKKMS